MVTPEGAVYCTLLLSDNYLPGAVVLAHSLRDNGSRAKLVAFYTPDTLQASTINELQAVYNVLIPVYRMTNHTPANLWLMERPDLIATFTKIELWRQTQFERIVYIDSDVVAVRAPDELLELDVDFAAAPDVGWPDCFNSGVMVLRPNMQDYFALKALAERGISFDGADQGLLNMHFRDWHRLSFTYNCTPSANYQYIPAYKHFQSTISLVHFIGSQKPWNMSRQVTPFDSPFNQLLGRWWAIYDRHYYPIAIEQIRPDTRAAIPHIVYTDESVSEIHVQTSHEIVQQQCSEQASVVTISVPQTDLSSSPQLEYHTREQTSNEAAQLSYPPESSDVTFPAQQPSEQLYEQPARQPVISVVPQYVWGEEHVKTYIQQHHQDHTHRFTQSTPEQGPSVSSEPAHPLGHGDSHHPQPQASIETQRKPSPRPPPQKPQEQPTFEAPQAEWDASREPPPLYSKPEGIALETKTYTMSDDNQLFQPPASYPEAPKNMYYQVPAVKPEPKKLTQIFPWEQTAPRPTRVFADEQPQIQRLPSPISAKEDSRTSQSSHPTSWTSEVPSLPSESWDTYSRSNAWDEVPEIQQYIQSIQGPRKGSVQVLSGGPSQQNTSTPTPTRQPGPNIGTRITDFPSETERPSLPVTPAPIHRAPATGSPDEFTKKQLPAAEGVPSQEDWVGLTVDVFLHLLRATYLYWEFTESFSPSRAVAPAAERRLGQFRFAG
ncbi:glycogenin [Aspergillus puulaauensis]|uniref:glycogenin glucosyltransferase n=1 Tax=Aspergillus puulaauensis TaxID=1220207 RepID=A0A7R7XMY2_9EURO|nr:glycogenin glucosyltransferase [Aspergillus puulaauensis]BCS23823.1 glycogenin glucosyltransferase [Aspergillus puulaauensis]